MRWATLVARASLATKPTKAWTSSLGRAKSSVVTAPIARLRPSARLGTWRQMRRSMESAALWSAGAASMSARSAATTVMVASRARFEGFFHVNI